MGIVTHVSEYLKRKSRSDQVAFIEPDVGEISYRELYVRAREFAAVLLEVCGSAPEMRVAVVQEKGVSAAISIFGALEAGYSYVPLDPTFPESRLRLALQACSISVVVTSADDDSVVTAVARGLGISVVEISEKNNIAIVNPTNGTRLPLYLSEADVERLLQACPKKRDTALAYMLFTSGTTGRPKAVMIRNDSLVAFIECTLEDFGYSDRTRWLSVSPLYFDVSTVDLFVQVAAGATVVLLKGIGFPNDLALALEKYRITDSLLVSSLLKMLASRFSGFEARNLSSLRSLFYGGEPCPVEVLRRIKQVIPQIWFAHGYGPSEVCNNSTLYRFSEIPDEYTHYMPLGKSIRTVESYVVNDDGALVSPGETGELLLGGVQVMEGYCNDPERTNCVLIPNKFNPSSPYKLYKTGDLVTLDTAGDLHFYGRRDDLIKSGGNLISLMEVQKSILACIGATDVHVFSEPDDIFTNKVVAIIVSDDAEITPTKVAKKLADIIPHYMLPKEILIVRQDSVPVKGTGKIDVQSLRQLAVGEAAV
ncbi:MAG: AMP-binding protein [Sulfuricaulis sp.]